MTPRSCQGSICPVFMILFVSLRRQLDRVNQFVKSIDKVVIGEIDLSEAIESGKKPVAVALGILSGRTGERAQAMTPSPRQRGEIVKRAAAARWGKHGGYDEGK